MGFSIRHNEPVAEAYQRILLEQVKSLVQHLGNIEKDRTTSIHEARKRCKRIRAILRLLRPTCKELYEEENAVFREISRWLSPFRDADVRLTAFDEVAARNKDQLEQITGVREHLALPPDADSPWALGSAVVHAAEKTGEARVRLKEIKLPAGRDFKLMENGLKWSYREGRRNMATAVEKGTEEAYHSWRKRVKDLDYQLQTLRQMWPNELRELQRSLEKLSDILGHHNDLSVLRTTLIEGPMEISRKRETRRFLEIAEEEEHYLRAQAAEAGRLIYAERPKDFIKRLEGYWETWRK